MAVMALILLRPQAAVNGAQKAMAAWYQSVAPAMFPFLALTPVLASPEACVLYKRAFGRVMGRLFALPGAAVPAILVSMLAGSPAGAIAIHRTAASGEIGRNDVLRLSIALCGLSPAYLILGVGQGLYGSAAFGWKLAGIQAALQLLLLAATRRFRFAENNACNVDAVQRAGGVASAIESMLAVCAYMVLFGSVTAAAASLLGRNAGVFLLVLMDLPGGSAALAASSIPGKMVLQCACIGFSGLCIAFQNMDVLKSAGLNWAVLLGGKISNAALFALAGMILIQEEGCGRLFAWNGRNIYAVALVFACIISAPAMIFLSKNLFLNNSGMVTFGKKKRGISQYVGDGV